MDRRNRPLELEARESYGLPVPRSCMRARYAHPTGPLQEADRPARHLLPLGGASAEAPTPEPGHPCGSRLTRPEPSPLSASPLRGADE